MSLFNFCNLLICPFHHSSNLKIFRIIVWYICQHFQAFLKYCSLSPLFSKLFNLWNHLKIQSLFENEEQGQLANKHFRVWALYHCKYHCIQIAQKYKWSIALHHVFTFRRQLFMWVEHRTGINSNTACYMAFLFTRHRQTLLALYRSRRPAKTLITFDWRHLPSKF